MNKVSKPDQTVTSASTKNFSVTEDYKKVKESEWWIRQKYKIMIALKRKWKDSQEDDYLKKSPNCQKLLKKPKLHKNDMGTSMISFDKIPHLNKGKDRDVNIEKITTIYSRDGQGKRQPK